MRIPLQNNLLLHLPVRLPIVLSFENVLFTNALCEMILKFLHFFSKINKLIHFTEFLGLYFFSSNFHSIHMDNWFKSRPNTASQLKKIKSVLLLLCRERNTICTNYENTLANKQAQIFTIHS